MSGSHTAHAAAIVSAVGAPLVLLAARRGVFLSGLALVAVAEAGLGYSRSTGSSKFHDVLAPAPVAGIAVGLLVLAGAAALLVRWPAVVPAVVVAAAPFRLPLTFDRQNRFLVGVADQGQLGRLLPLYGVLAAATVAYAYRVARGKRVRPLPTALSYPAAAFLALASLSLLWAEDLQAGTNLLGFFLLPFALLVAVVGRAPFETWLPRVLAWIGVGLAVIFAVIGIVQAGTHTLLFYSPTVEVANTYASFFRVTSLFRDPSLYGRHVVLGIVIVLVAVWLKKIRPELALALIAVLFAGLYFSYSQSSFVALFVVVVLVTAAIGDRRGRQLVAAVAVILALVGAGVVAAAVRDGSVRKATSDRSRRVETTFKVFRQHPLEGVGLGSQPLASQRNSARFGQKPRFVSHATPLTIAAELGIVGFLAYVWFLVGAGETFDAVRRRNTALGLTLAAVFVALFVHSLFYSGFVEDPITWVAVALAASFLVYNGAVSEAPGILARWQAGRRARKR
jgi:O-Antigen ligase